MAHSAALMDVNTFKSIVFSLSVSLVDGHHLWESEAKVVREASKSVSDLSDNCSGDKFPFSLLD